MAYCTRLTSGGDARSTRNRRGALHYSPARTLNIYYATAGLKNIQPLQFFFKLPISLQSPSAVTGVACQLCGGTMLFERRCETGLSLHRDAILIRCIAENKDGWRCEDRGGRDFCPAHAHLAIPSNAARGVSDGKSPAKIAS